MNRFDLVIKGFFHFSDVNFDVTVFVSLSHHAVVSLYLLCIDLFLWCY